MKACGLIVEYNPFHNGHQYHLHEAKKQSGADCMIAVMSGDFLQRGEPAIMDKKNRALTALHNGVDIVVELPYVYAVQSSDLFAQGAIHILQHIAASFVCFGSEAGNVQHFLNHYDALASKERQFNQIVKQQLQKGLSFPEANRHAHIQLGLNTVNMDLSKPNNILGFSYVRAILDHAYTIQPLTIKRKKSGYHDQTITSSIASATSIRKAILQSNQITMDVSPSIPASTTTQLLEYQKKMTTWHQWEYYFPLLHYKIMTMSLRDLGEIHGVDEGIEHRIKKIAKQATSFTDLVGAIKTKRYTWTRLQRMFTHILTNTTKKEIELTTTDIPYVRVLGFNHKGKQYLHQIKKQMDVPIIMGLGRNPGPMLNIEERASQIYYSILPPAIRLEMYQMERQFPLIIEKNADH